MGPNDTHRFSYVLTAVGLLISSAALAQVQVPNCEIRVLSQGRLNNASRSDANLSAVAPDGRVRLGRNVFFEDDTSVSGALVGLGNGASVFDVNVDDLHRGRGSDVRGSQNDFDSSPLDCNVTPVACGGQSLTVRKNRTASLSPGTYNLIDLENGASLTLTPGPYNICELRTGRNASID